MIATLYRTICIFVLAFVVCCVLIPSARAETLAILEVDIYNYRVYKAIKALDLPPAIETRTFSLRELENNDEAKAYIAGCSVVFVNVMMGDMADYMVDNDLVRGKVVYATRRACIQCDPALPGVH